MKGLRVTALGLVVGLCLLAAAPAVQAEDTWVPGRLAAADPGDWLGYWMTRLAGWFGWGEEQGQGSSEPRAVWAAHGCGIDPNGNPVPCPPSSPAPSSDHGCGIDPNGSPLCN
jgi:hypothetical protein